ncbi:MAG: polysaccharide deacetylase family protein, partial [Actinobacteria bacterium]|nr:polysaccharide deacetylase family protein [Actinomycetota bacterium]
NMSSSEIKEISQYGIEIGDHTISHPDLTKIPKEKTQKEITESKKTLEALTGKPVISFCYPSGKFNSEVEGEVKNAGYSYATTTIGGITSFGNLFELNRYRVNKDTSITKYFQ